MNVSGHEKSTGINNHFYWDGDKLSHAYIVAGNLADSLAMAVVCSGSGGKKPCMTCPHCGKAARHIHPDIIIVDKLPDKREIVIEQLRELKKDVIVVPNEAGKKAYIINDADSMNVNAQNAFLQILEEPPSHAVFILRTENPVALLPTVRSRCVHLKTKYETDAPDSTATEMANGFFSAIDRGNVPLTKFMFRLEKLDKNAFNEFLTTAHEQVAMRLRAPVPNEQRLSYETLARTERFLIRAREMFDLNVGIGHISGMLCAGLINL